MRFIPTRAHGFLDYLVGFVLIGLPLTLDVEGNGGLALIALGSFVILYSLLTDYEFGAVRFLRLRFHLFSRCTRRHRAAGPSLAWHGCY